MMWADTATLSSGRGKAVLCAALALLVGCGLIKEARAFQIVPRPLTPQEIHDLHLPEDTQRASGLKVVGVGQPAYLEVQVPIGTVVTQVLWSLDGQPAGSTASLTNSPLDMSVEIYSPGDREINEAVSRMMLRPDKVGAYDVSAEVSLTNGVQVLSRQIIGAKYVGINASVSCRLCHPSRTDEWETTGHSHFFKDSINGLQSSHYNGNCISCHTVGFDEHPDADNEGFDDIAADVGWTFPATLATNNWDDMDPELQNKANIQCENCHGAGSQHIAHLDDEGNIVLADTNRIAVSTSSGDCAQCHDEEPYHTKNIEWNQSAHAVATRYPTGSERRRSCVPCHSGIGFIDSTDGVAFDDLRFEYEAIVCAACHDPHAADNPHQIRAIGSATLGNGTVITTGGNGKLCMNCHKGRRDSAVYVEDELGDPSSHFGPHYGTQTDMLAGQNAYDFGLTLGSSTHLLAVEDACVHCHLQDVPGSSPASGKAGGHTFKMAWDGDTPEDPEDDVHLTGACVACHGPLDDFNFGGADYDGDGVIEGVQHEVEDLLHELAMLLPPLGSEEVDMGQLTTDTDDAARAQLMAAFNWEFVHEDGSHGVHNAKFAVGVLKASIAALTTGIDDLDGDGLSDAWEIQWFGSTTAQNGQGDDDGDGVENSLEMALGTDPTKKDTDGDGFDDFAELQAGSDPLNIADIPAAGASTLHWALELVSVLDPGQSYQVQAIDTLGGSWTNVGDVVEGAGQEMQHFISIRRKNNQFFRVVETP